MEDTSDVCILIPTLEEAATIDDVVHGFIEEGFENILVIDGGSTDGTQSRAREAGARVVEQTGSGKGQAVQEAVHDEISAPYVVMIDGDGTYVPSEVDRLLAPILTGRADHVIGNRFANMEPGAMTRLNRFGNARINQLFRYVNRRDLSDILSGYRAFSRESFSELDLSSSGFGIEAEMAGECLRKGQRVEVVPISYRSRPDDSDSNLHPLRDGAVIVRTLYRVARMHNPLFIFGGLGVVGLLVGTLLGFYVGYRWYYVGVSHEVLAVVASFALIFGLQLVMFGVLSDMIVSLHQEQRQRIAELRDRLE